MSACTKFERSRWTATPYRSDLRKPEAEAEAEAEAEPTSRHATRSAERGVSATKTRQYDPESRPRMPFRPSAIRGHSTVASNHPTRNNDTFYAHIGASAYCGDGSSGARVSRFAQSVRKSSRFNQSEPSSRHAPLTV